MRLSDVAPRLARARDEWEAIAREHRRQARIRATKRLQVERLVAHRELQLLRACATGRRDYIAERRRKLDAALRAQQRLRTTSRSAEGSA